MLLKKTKRLYCIFFGVVYSVVIYSRQLKKKIKTKTNKNKNRFQGHRKKREGRVRSLLCNTKHASNSHQITNLKYATSNSNFWIDVEVYFSSSTIFQLTEDAFLKHLRRKTVIFRYFTSPMLCPVKNVYMCVLFEDRLKRETDIHHAMFSIPYICVQTVQI